MTMPAPCPCSLNPAPGEWHACLLLLRLCPLIRHYRRYWMLGSTCDLLYIEDPEGEGLGMVASVEELDDLMCRLNRRGCR